MNNKELISEILEKCSSARHPDARELARILNKPHVKSLIATHDEVGEQPVKDSPKRIDFVNHLIDIENNEMPSETIKMVGLRRNPNEPLGLTVEVDEHKQLMVARILSGGMIDRQGLLHPGDVILEVNGVPVSTPEGLQEQISLAKESVTLKIGPSLDEEMKSARLTMSGGQVKNGRNLDTGKKLTVSCVFGFHFFILVVFRYIKFGFTVHSLTLLIVAGLVKQFFVLNLKEKFMIFTDDYAIPV